MGLDISVYRNAVLSNGNEALDEYGEIKGDDGFVRIYVNPDFPGRADPLLDQRAYKAECVDSFHAGSYGGYNGWRNELAKLAGYPETDNGESGWNHRAGHDVGAWDAGGGPFWELIYFSDCEGTIGPVVSKKLAADFAEYQAAADAHKSSYFRKKYAEWRKAFEAAADNGFVAFY